MRSNKKWPLFEVSYIFEKWLDFDEIFGGNPHRLQVFFAHIFKSIWPVLKKLRAKMHFFTFSKTSKNTYMTRKIHPPKHWHYGFLSYFGFGSKHSIAIFSTIQNVIWSRIHGFRAFWKLRDFPFLTCFLTWFFQFLHVKYRDNLTFCSHTYWEIASKFMKILVFPLFSVIFCIVKTNYFLDISPIYERFLT